MGRLTTHVLDTARGLPASGLRIQLFSLQGGARREVASATTNDDGRIDGPVAEGEGFEAGEYELVFHAGAYFDRIGLELPKPKFLDTVVLRFGVADPGQHYHVPLLLSPFGYSTYRGS
jgi:5-hydroxyisourate hydrolase